MVLKNEDLVHEFYSKISDKYPTLNLDQTKEAVFTPWKFLRQEMESGELDTVRLKYFGTFQVYEGRAKHMLHSIKERNRYNKIDPNQFKKLKGMLEKFINKKDE